MMSRGEFENLVIGDTVLLESPLSFRPRYVGRVKELLEDGFIIADNQNRQTFCDIRFNSEGVEHNAIGGYVLVRKV